MRHTPGPWQIESYPADSKLPEELVIHTERDVVAKLRQAVEDAAETLTAALDAGELTDALYLLRVRLTDLLTQGEEL